MRYLLWILGLFAAAVAFNTALPHPAYVMLVYPPFRIELSLALFMALLLCGFLLSYWTARLLHAILKLPAHVRQYRLERATTQARELLNRALGEFFEGRYAAAELAAVRAMESGDASALPHIIAARSAHELREYKKRDAYLSTVGSKTPGDTTMRLIETAPTLPSTSAASAVTVTAARLRMTKRFMSSRRE